MGREGRSRLAPAVLLALALAAFALLVGRRGLFETSEGRYGSIAAEMVRSGDWLVPHLNGVQHFEKPPLSMWAMATSLRVLGESETALRIPGILAALAALAAAAQLAGGRRSPRARWAVLTTLASPLFFGLAQAVTTDIYLAACSAWALAAASRSLDPSVDERARARALGWAAVASALGFMVKGPVIWILTLGPILIEALWSRDLARCRALFAPWRIALFAVIALPWYLLVSARTPGLFSWFLGARLAGPLTSSRGMHPGPFFFYVPVVLLGFLPASGILLAAGRVGWTVLAGDRRQRLLLCAVLFPLLVLSLSASKLATYVLPLVVPAAVLAASALESELGTKGIAGGGVAFGLTALAAAVAAVLRGTLDSVPPHVRWLFAAAGLVALLGAVATVVLALRRRARESCGTLIGAQLAALLLCIPAVSEAEPALTRAGPGREIARTLSTLAADGREIVCYGCFVRSLPFYTHRRILVANFYEPDVAYERDLAAVDVHGSEDLRAVLARGPAVILCRTQQAEQLQRDVDRLQRVSEIGRYTILSSDPGFASERSIGG